MNRLLRYIQSPVSIAPLAVFRIVFGGILFVSTLRFIFKGWVYSQYIQPSLYFPYYGFEWVKPLPALGMYVVFGLMALSFLLITLGAYYKLASTVAFVSFTYVELLDKTNYLNHYYFVSIMCFLIIWLPANRYFAWDVVRRPKRLVTHVPRWTIDIIKVQLFIVYFFAGVAKLNYDWLVLAMPLKIWLPSKANLPLIGGVLQLDWVAYLFSWFGAVYDLSVPVLLINKKTRLFAYFLVIVFHMMTGILFQIGMFPYIMILVTLIFFSADFHQQLLDRFSVLLRVPKQVNLTTAISWQPNKVWSQKILISLFTIHLMIQVLFPFRYVLYPGNLFWTEEGYRFSWRVMLMEKAGYAVFKVRDTENKKEWEVNNYDYLTPVQEKMMATQPDMILQFAHFLEKKYKQEGIRSPQVYVESYVTLNGKKSRLFIDSNVDLTKKKESFKHKEWILAYSDK